MYGAQKNAETDVDSVYDQGTQQLSPVSCGQVHQARSKYFAPLGNHATMDHVAAQKTRLIGG